MAVADSDNAITAAPDGSDTISGFTLGEDRLTFVDTDGTPPVATNDASAVDVLMTAIGAAGGVSLVYDGTNYTGITFGIDGTTTLSVIFAASLDEPSLIAKLADASMGGDATITDANLGTIFDGNSAPTEATPENAPAALSTAGLALIDTLFGNTDEVAYIDVGNSLPEELL